jgi:membrane protein
VIESNFGSRKVALLAGAGAGILVVRAAAPTILTWLSNLGVQKISGYRGRVRRVTIDLTAPRLVVQDLSLAKLDGGRAEHLLHVDSIVVGTHWKHILSGSLTAYIRLHSPQLFVDLERISELAANHDNGNRPSRENEASGQVPWQKKLEQLPPFRISSAVVTDGEVHARGLSGQNGADIRIDQLNICVENITNSIKIAPSLMAKATCKARVMSNGSLDMRAEGYPLAQPPTFNVDLQITNFDLTEIRSLIEERIGIDVRRGIVDLFVEAAAADGYIQGYAKPIFDHLEIEPPKDSSFTTRIKAWGAEAVVKLGKNKPKDRIATRLDFEGSLDDPELNITDAILTFFRNSFRTAERALLEDRIGFFRAGRTADEVKICFGNEPRSRLKAAFALLKETINRWSKDEAPRMAASLSYYTIFSMAPLLILAISIAGFVLGRDAAQGKIVEQISSLVGMQSAAAIQSMIQAANRPSKGIFAGVVGIISLLAGATGVLSELKSALNKIWRTEEPGDVKEIVKKNVLFLGMLLGIGFLLAVSLILSAAVAALGRYLAGFLPAPEMILQIANFAFSVGVVALLFAAMYRFLPNTKIEWRDVWFGAIVTSVLFNLGKLGLGLYLGKSAVSSSYGAAGSVLILLLWVYYSGLIFYFGAEFTKVYTERMGSRKIRKSASARPRRISSSRELSVV